MSARLKDRRRRFLEKIELRDGHWLWTGAVNSASGTPSYRGHWSEHREKPINPYREAFRLFENRVVRGFRRQCDERLCVKPAHYARSYRPVGHSRTTDPEWMSVIARLPRPGARKESRGV